MNDLDNGNGCPSLIAAGKMNDYANLLTPSVERFAYRARK
jgi:hypothetical protein